MSDIALSGKTLEMVPDVFVTSTNFFALRILQSLSPPEKTVTHSVKDFDANQSNVSKHLNILLETGKSPRKEWHHEYLLDC